MINTRFAVKRDGVRRELHAVRGTEIIVYRADDALQRGFRPYVKCAVLPSFCDWAKSINLTAVGYYASRESFWVGDLKREAEKRRIRAFITHPITKHPPDWAREVGDSMHMLKPNVYSVNYNISKRLLREKYGEDVLMLPMGIDVPAFVRLQTIFFEKYPLPIASTYVVPSGSGTAAACIANALGVHHCFIYAISTRPARSVEKVIEHNTLMDARIRVHEFHGEMVDGATWPVTKNWERTAYSWLHERAHSLIRPICFVNLGR